VCAATCRRGGTGDRVQRRRGFSSHRKDGQNHPSESRKVEGRHYRMSTNWRGYGARALHLSGDRWYGGDGVNIVTGVRGGRKNGGICGFEGDSLV